MDLVALIPVGTLVLGSALTFFGSLLNGHITGKRDERKAAKLDESRRASIGRDHALKALVFIRAASDESWRRHPSRGDLELNVDGLDLELAEAEIDLIPDPSLRPKLARVLHTVRYPWTLAQSSFSRGAPVHSQRQGLYLMREALAAYIREEPTPSVPDALANLAKDAVDAESELEENMRKR